MEKWIRDCLKNFTNAVIPGDPTIALSISLMCEWLGRKDDDSDVELSKVGESFYLLKIMKVKKEELSQI